MSNDPRDLDGQKLQRALALLGREEALRMELVEWLKKAEARVTYTGAIRDDISGPIIDALHTDDDRLAKTLADGTKFEFLYRTKIARDFMLSALDHPSHVWEPQTTRLLQHLASHTAGDVLIGGAYFGDHAILLGKQLAPEGRKVHCFEPNTVQSGMLLRNIEINSLTNLQVHTQGLWDENSLRLRLDGFDSFANVVLANKDEEGFETVRIDDYMAAEKRSLGIIMLDIEGAELRALKGATAVLQADRPAIVFEVHRDYVDWSNGLAKAEICAFLALEGYHLFAVRDFNTNQEMSNLPVELVPVDDVFLEGPPHGFNMLAVTDLAQVSGSLFKHVSGVSPKLLRHKAPALHHPLDGLPT
jgi:FkbM family methyltransferase